MESKRIRILALDPGMVTGYAVLLRDDTRVELLDYGVIGAPSKEPEALVCAHWEWLQKFNSTEKLPYDLCFEGPILVRSLPSSYESQEVRGVIRLFGNTTEKVRVAKWYSVPTVKAFLTHRAGAKKKDVAKAVSDIFGVKKFAADHMPDAIAVGVTHLWKEYEITLKAQTQTQTQAQEAA